MRNNINIFYGILTILIGLLLIFLARGNFGFRMLSRMDDKFEYAYHSQNLLETGEIGMIGDFEGGITNRRFSLYSKFPGTHIIVSSVSHITGLRPIEILGYLNFISTLIFYFTFIIFSRLSNQKKTFKSLFVAFLGIMILMLIRGDVFVIFSTRYINYRLFIVSIIIYEKKRDIFPLIITIFGLFMIINHHQSTIGILILYVIMLGIYIYKNGGLNKKNYLAISIGLVFFLLYFIYFFYPDIHRLLQIFEGISISNVEVASRRSSDTFSKMKIFVLPLLFRSLYSWRKIESYLKILIFTCLIFTFQYPLFGLTLFPERFFELLIILLILVGIKIINEGRSLMLMIVTGVILSTLPYGISLKQNLSLGYLDYADYVLDAEIIPTGSKVLADPATAFMFFKLAGIKQSYRYPRPLGKTKTFFPEWVDELGIYTEDSVDSIILTAKQNGYNYIIFDTAITPVRTGFHRRINVDLRENLYKDENVDLIGSYGYKTHGTLNSKLLLYRLNY